MFKVYIEVNKTNHDKPTGKFYIQTVGMRKPQPFNFTRRWDYVGKRNTIEAAIYLADVEIANHQLPMYDWSNVNK